MTARTDRELLALAAKIGGFHANEWAEPGELCFGAGGFVQFFGYGKGSVWNPLTDDGDALRLAVKLNFDIIHISLCAVATVAVPICIEIWREGDDDPLYTHYAQTGDKYEATRHAITRAAAEIGARL